MGPLRLIDITFWANREYTHPDEILTAQQTSLEYIKYITDDISVTVVKHGRLKAIRQYHKAAVYFFSGRNWFFYCPLRTLAFLKKRKPDIVIIQGFDSPWQVLLLRWVLDKHIKFLIQHHGGQPYAFPKKIWQQWAGKSADAFLFTSNDNAVPWIRSGIVKHQDQCYELLEASTFLQKKDKEESRRKLAFSASDIFLWVGRLNANKDPITVLQGFAIYLINYPEACLYMIYQTEELLPQVMELLSNNPLLKKSVHMIGKIPHAALADWYSAANFYISGSYTEGSGYALIEAMSCGCIPVVTDIPSFRKITGNGSCGFLFEAGNVNAISEAMVNLNSINQSAFSEKVSDYFAQELSFTSIAERLGTIVRELNRK